MADWTQEIADILSVLEDKDVTDTEAWNTACYNCSHWAEELD